MKNLIRSDVFWHWAAIVFGVSGVVLIIVGISKNFISFFNGLFGE